MVVTVLRLNFGAAPSRTRRPAVVVTREWGMPKRLAQTQHRLADRVEGMLRERIRLSASGVVGSRELRDWEIAAMERTLAPYAELGTALPADPITVWLMAVMRGDPRVAPRPSLAECVLRWANGDKRAADSFITGAVERLRSEWRSPEGVNVPHPVLESWVVQLAMLFARVEDGVEQVATQDHGRALGLPFVVPRARLRLLASG